MNLLFKLRVKLRIHLFDTCLLSVLFWGVMVVAGTLLPVSSAMADTTVTDTTCPVAGAINNCVANDATPIVESTTSGTCVAGTTVSVDFTVTFPSTANVRYDPGIYVNNETGSIDGGACSLIRFSGTGDVDTDTGFVCSDVSSAGTTQTFTVQTECAATVDVVSFWDNKASNGACTDVDQPKCLHSGISTGYTVIDPAPQLDVTKTPSVEEYTAPTTVTYTYVVTNSGNVSISDLALTDDIIGTVCSVSTLAVGASTTCTATYSVTQADVDAGSVTNIVTATGTPAAGTLAPATATATITAILPVLNVTKTPSLTEPYTAPTTVTYTYVVTNSGNVSISALALTDDIIGTVTCPVSTLAVGASTTCTATYSVTQADVDAGSVTNIVTATGTPAAGTLAPATATAKIVATQSPLLALEKKSTTINYDTVGGAINYTYTVTNTGNVTITGIGVSDDKIGVVTCSPTTLAPTEQATCTASYTVTQADINNGQVVNTATASGSFNEEPVTSAQAQETVRAYQKKSLSLDKYSDPLAFKAVGDVITYYFGVTNSGNTTLAGPVAVTDSMFASVACPAVTSLAPGATVTCTAEKTITQADLDAGIITNTASASAAGVTSNPDTHNIETQQLPALVVTKTAIAPGDIVVGSTIAYVVTVKNTGNITLSNVLVDDPLTGTNDTLCAAKLAPTATCDVEIEYAVTQADIDAEQVVNTATATSGTVTGSGTAIVLIPAPIGSPSLSVVKTRVGSGDVYAGDTLTFKIKVTNTGTVVLTNVLINDALTSTTNLLCAASLAIDASCEKTVTYTVTEADATAGSLTNVATVISNEGLEVEGTVTVVVTSVTPPPPPPPPAPAENIPVFGPLGVLATLLGLALLGKRRRK